MAYQTGRRNEIFHLDKTPLLSCFSSSDTSVISDIADVSRRLQKWAQQCLHPESIMGKLTHYSGQEERETDCQHLGISLHRLASHRLVVGWNLIDYSMYPPLIPLTPKRKRTSLTHTPGSYRIERRTNTQERWEPGEHRSAHPYYINIGRGGTWEVLTLNWRVRIAKTHLLLPEKAYRWRYRVARQRKEMHVNEKFKFLLPYSSTTYLRRRGWELSSILGSTTVTIDENLSSNSLE
jgi:hypothetical protein